MKRLLVVHVCSLGSVAGGPVALSTKLDAEQDVQMQTVSLSFVTIVDTRSENSSMVRLNDGGTGPLGAVGFLCQTWQRQPDAQERSRHAGHGSAGGRLHCPGVHVRFKLDWDTGGSTAAFFAGVSLMTGIIAFVFAPSHGGKASIVVPMTAMYPVVTIALSVGILKEQIMPTTGMGVVFAMIAVFLLSK